MALVAGVLAMGLVTQVSPAAATTSVAAAAARPGASNTGVPVGTKLTTVHGDITVTQAGTVLNALDVYGFIKVRAANVTITNSRIHGANTATTSTGLIDAASPAVSHLVIQHCELTDDTPSIWVDGVIGHDYTARYNEVHNVIDGFGVFNPNAPATNLQVIIQQNWVYDLTYMSPDQTHSDNHTHNDGVQIQGTGASAVSQVQILNNTITAMVGPKSTATSPYAPMVTGQAIAVTPNVSSIHDVQINGNMLDGGAQSVTMIPTPVGTGANLVLSNNTFGRDQYTHRGVLITLPVQLKHWGNFYTDGSSVPVYTQQ